MMSAESTPSFAERMREHQARYRCHVCGVASAGPFCENGEGADRSNEVVCNWEIPRSLVRCDICQRWACDIHIKNMGYEVWWTCIVCFLELSARIAEEAGDAAAKA
jgi:hypothetical protein